MKVAHICLSNLYIDGRAYQENELVRQHVTDGHETLVIASTETHASTGKICYVEPSDYIGTEGARVIRLPYSRFLPHMLATKLRMHSGVKRLLYDFSPDAMLHHGICGWELLSAAQYKRENPTVRFYADTHTDWNNSARSFISKELLHKLYYRPVIRRALPTIQKVLCVSTETMEFAREVYGIEADKLEFFPLGGTPVPNTEYDECRKTIRAAYSLSEQHTLFLQSGKLTRRKRLLESLRAFGNAENPNFRLFIVGILSDDIKEEAIRLIEQDGRVIYLGWQSTTDLTALLCAADVYLQPGTQSATMQHSLCCRCAIILDNVPAHKVYHINNGWLIDEKMPLLEIFNTISRDPRVIKTMQQKSFDFASENLAYSKISRRILV